MSETSTCAGPHCDKAVRTKGLCSGHYAQQRKGRALQPLRPMRKRNMSTEEMGRWIIEQVDIDPDSGCWIWPHTLDRMGYGRVGFQGKMWPVHRLTFSIFMGPLVEGLVLDHIACISRACCNPSHLRQVSQAGNTQNRQALQSNNTSGHPGVRWNKQREKWHTQIKVGRKTVFLGRFTNLDDAIAARKAGEEKYHPYRDPEYREPVAS